MEFNFNEHEIIFMYKHFKEQVQILENIKNNPSNPIDDVNMNQNIKLYYSIIDKLQTSCPNLIKLANCI